jgi:hypothetical protein
MFGDFLFGVIIPKRNRVHRNFKKPVNPVLEISMTVPKGFLCEQA